MSYLLDLSLAGLSGHQSTCLHHLCLVLPPPSFHSWTWSLLHIFVSPYFFLVFLGRCLSLWSGGVYLAALSSLLRVCPSQFHFLLLYMCLCIIVGHITALSTGETNALTEFLNAANSIESLSEFTAHILTSSTVRRDIRRHNCTMEGRLVIGFFGQPHCCSSPYYPVATWSLLNHFGTRHGPWLADFHRWALPTQLSVNADDSRQWITYWHVHWQNLKVDCSNSTMLKMAHATGWTLP